MKKRIYLDHAASTPLDKRVLEAMMPYLEENHGNPSSSHAFGQVARAAIEQARRQAAVFLGCAADEIIFTSGATEANNLAIQGAVKKYHISHITYRTNSKFQSSKPHIVTTAIEHESVLGTCRILQKEGLADVTYVQPKADGIVRTEDVMTAIRSNTILVSVMYANSQIGTIQPVEEIGEQIALQKSNNKWVYPVYHIDAVQAVNFLDCSVTKLHADLMTLSGHKIYGPKGVGILYMKAKAPLIALLEGGGQEMGMRSGTENIPGIVGMGKALADVTSPKRESENRKMKQLQKAFIAQIAQQISKAQLTGSVEKRLPNNVHVRFPGVPAYDLVVLLDQKDIACSVGSACSEKTQEPSYVLLAMGLSEEEANSAIRFTLGKDTTEKEIQKTVQCLIQSVAQLQKK